jgi:divalent metal cation (Fe/Co/Zn/Cd) transporter
VADQIRLIVEAVPGVTNCHHVRVRYAGAFSFADIHVLVEGGLKLDEVHTITEAIEKAVHLQLPTIDLVVHPEPDSPQFRPKDPPANSAASPESTSALPAPTSSSKEK